MSNASEITCVIPGPGYTVWALGLYRAEIEQRKVGWWRIRVWSVVGERTLDEGLTKGREAAVVKAIRCLTRYAE